ncbi:hypothetical protein SJ05684_c10410 [Sinorhizobium sojae CCBAU 05684]|uniref:Uncharacterized protein n=1 Tax=Sinorhizobium sojae CCBAU 05684 TaxID=716928 RepID=A0A249PB39_9HYPH|nr:hypothetical protein [Sinorhizobium sojae]ASY62499.1 hypothetical protein SJ05684_c10410 [Sinorhizobium sojae CCBAU 05684]
MNLAEARGVLTAKGWKGEYRLVWKAKHEPVRFLRNDGKPGPIMYFTSEVEAELVAWRRKSQLEQPVMVRSGDKLAAHKAEAERVFKQKGSASPKPKQRRSA